ncbi:GAF domain-containing protein [Fibrella sp. HMF5335]|uniref:histidine kinase n=1 Tax=Fibrella rubiginis TaxID=2817060 RepID=A0A939GEF5_9BACT|nr:ATP-binding protein [Fibrella rubiginis]MBO0936268.1 GAF domain-containing protein [Fibrella rubiginis]
MQPTVDLTNCDREPIQWPGFIQSHGYLLAIDPATFVIWQASENCQALTGLPTNTLIGQNLSGIRLHETAGTELVDLLTVALRQNNPEAFNPYLLPLGDQSWYLVIHQHDGALILELEPTADLINLPLQTTAPLLNKTMPIQALLAQTMTDIQRSSSLTDLLHKTAQKVKELTGYDRVMIYRFGEDWHGEIIAEACEPFLEPFLNMHYPASDIPRQARELYKTNLVRLLVDVDAPRVPIYPVQYADQGRPLDLTHAGLRAVSPLHIEYLQNMGVRATLNISLLYRGELWGLISCHHYAGPRMIDYPKRASVKLISQLLSTALEIRKDDEDEQFSHMLNQREQQLYHQMLADWDIVQGLTKHPLTALELNTATGAALLFENKLYTLGHTPADSDIQALIEWLKMVSTDAVFQTDQLPNLYAPAELYREQAAGALVLVLSREMNEYLIWFKPEQKQTQYWGGNPEKPVVLGEDGTARLSPRKSFDKWEQLVRNRSEPWRQVEVATALKLREDMLQLISQKANQIRALNEQLRLAYEELEAFSYTISHDLRTPLSSIKSYTEIYLEDYGETMPQEARATFDKITKASDRMAMLIRNVMHYSRMSRTELSMESLAVKPMLTQLREELLAGENGRDLTIQIGNTPPLLGDQTMVTQVFSNLLSNAVKYSRLTPKARIQVQGSETEQEVIYAITDNGIGIDMKQAGKVFELFQRLDSAVTYEGYGVGLAIVKRIMSRHRGKVWFDSSPMYATTFFVSFPKTNQPASSL